MNILTSQELVQLAGNADLRGDHETAGKHYRAAAELAEQAGDSAQAARCRHAAVLADDAAYDTQKR